MSRGLPRVVKSLLNKARESAILAVETYNRPGAVFRSRAYVVLMHIAWTSLLLAIFHRGDVKPYRKKGSRRYEKVDGERVAWDLTECVRQYWKGRDDAVAQNLRFFIGLRNRIEHRDLPELDIEIFGECQALLFNFEQMIEKEFGSKYALNDSLAISLQFSRIRQGNRDQSIREIMKPVSSSVVHDFIQKFRSALSDEVFADMAYSYRVFLLPKIVSHRSRDSVAIEWVCYDPSDPEDMARYEKITALVKEKHVEVLNPGRLRPSDVVRKVAESLGPQKKFTVWHHTRCWRHFQVRPPADSSTPAHCVTEFCQYDEAHKDYVYTEKWVEFLIEQLKDDEKCHQILIEGDS